MAEDESLCSGAGCGRLIRWALTEAGKRIPLDPEPNPDGNVVLVDLPGGRIRARVLAGHDPRTGDEVLWMPHKATCPASDQFKRRQYAAAVKCAAGCGYPMAQWLIDNGHRYHPGCDPNAMTAGFRETAAAARAARAEQPTQTEMETPA